MLEEVKKVAKDTRDINILLSLLWLMLCHVKRRIGKTQQEEARERAQPDEPSTLSLLQILSQLEDLKEYMAESDPSFPSRCNNVINSYSCIHVKRMQHCIQSLIT
ncbi:hypothetical protein Pcinc_021640 [Petrolisthes cinctipes]|uniref:Uncharacterized protein n=1 Tax=Petrolisthes cinctipes TaxID=88211 RepID=A0AAE1KI49_PETCI|nr:hypothetical protein Pcinc_021640 [Petrolisthes cinctipes]